ncbi:MAG: ABC transporter permease [Lachnospiraceae bacterium]|nr:ABC transporter permease [Lachnospiraceae bacterium]MDD3797043.1 ABC transporter permease [Lachnospiraceae bacterium]
MFENIRLAFKGIWSHKMRSFLTMLGIIIGIASIIAIVSTIKGTNEDIKNKLVGSGNNTVKVKMNQNSYDYDINSSDMIPWGIPVVTQETKDEILALDEVEAVTTYSSRRAYEGVYYQNTALTDVAILGIDTSYFKTCNYVITTGRNFMQEDYDLYRKVIIVDDTAAKILFESDNPLGKTVEISGTPFTVIGVVKEASNFQPEISSVEEYYTYYSGDSSGFMYMPKASWPIAYCYDEPENVVVKATSTDDMTQAGSKTAKILNATITNADSDIKYKAEDLLGQAQQIQELSNATNMQLIWIAGISLLVGGIGVMNIMLVSVTERTSEIGLKKAIGAKKSVILGQFLTEAAVLTSLGGLLGVGAGVGAAQVIHRLSGIAVAIDVPAAILAVMFSMIIGIVFGFLPSVQASNLDPIEALRRE